LPPCACSSWCCPGSSSRWPPCPSSAGATGSATPSAGTRPRG
jgi:hypothetical protein